MLVNEILWDYVEFTVPLGLLTDEFFDFIDELFKVLSLYSGNMIAYINTLGHGRRSNIFSVEDLNNSLLDIVFLSDEISIIHGEKVHDSHHLVAFPCFACFDLPFA